MFGKQVFFPLAPGIESIWEPFQEEVEQRVQEVQQQIDDAMDGRPTHVMVHAHYQLGMLSNLQTLMVQMGGCQWLNECVLHHNSPQDSAS